MKGFEYITPTLSKRVSLLRMEISFGTCYPFSNKNKMCSDNVNPILIRKIYFRGEVNHIYSHSEWYGHSDSF